MKRMWSKNELKNMTQEQLSSGQLKNVKIFENIVDKDGHPRFIEGDLTIIETLGVVQTYGKWALSGSHLLIVLCIDVANGTTLSSKLCNINVPSWILDKIVPIASTLVDFNGGYRAWNDDASGSQGVDLLLRKIDNVLSLQVNMTATADRHLRIAFDLLIDNE